MKSRAFPRKSVVWTGAILGGIVNATMTAENALYAAHRQWDGNHYILEGMDGRAGVITFEEGHWSGEGRLVGVYFFSESERSPYVCKEEYDLERFFRGCPPYQRSLADQAALPYLQMEDDGKVLSLVTTAFWDAGEYLAAADPWEEVMANGVNLISDELIEDRETTMAGFQTSYGMSAAQVTFARSVFERKLARPATTIELTAADVQWLASTFEDPKARAAENIRLAIEHGQPVADLKWPESVDSTAEAQKAMQSCRESFAAMGILMP